MLLKTAKKDVRSVTGQNYRNIMLLVNKTSVEAVKKENAEKIDYVPMNETENYIQEIINVKNRTLDIANFEVEEIEEILTHLCTS